MTDEPIPSEDDEYTEPDESPVPMDGDDENGDDAEDYHAFDCTCETCLQDHPERDILYGDGEYFNW